MVVFYSGGLNAPRTPRTWTLTDGPAPRPKKSHEEVIPRPTIPTGNPSTGSGELHGVSGLVRVDSNDKLELTWDHGHRQHLLEVTP